MKKLLLTGLLAALAVPATMSAMDDALDQVALNFNISNKNNATANTVIVDSELEGVTAKIVSLTNNGNNLGLLNQSTPANILIPNANGNTSPNINLQIEVEGLPEAEINNIALNIWAYNGQGGTQVGNIDNANQHREWNIAVAINEDTYASIDGLEITYQVPNSNLIWTGEGETAAVSTDPLILDITISASSATNVGCFFGIESITFNYTEPVIESEYDINDVIGTYSGTYEDYDYNSFDIKGVIVAKGNSENSLVITNLFPSLQGMSVNATFDPTNNTIIIPEQWIGTTDYYFAPYDDYDWVDKAILSVIDDKLTSPDDVALYVFEDGTDADIDEMFSLNLTKESGSTGEPEPDPDSPLTPILGTYDGTSHLQNNNEIQSFVATIEENKGVDNGVKINGIFLPFAEGYVTGTFNPNNNTISVPSQWLKDESGNNSDYYVYISGTYGTITFSVQDGIILMQGSDYFDLYAYYNGSLPQHKIVDIQLVKAGEGIPTIDDLAASYSATWFKNAALNNPGQATASIEVESNNTILISGLLNGFTFPATYNEETGELTIKDGDVDSKYSDLPWPMLYLYEKNGNSYTRVSSLTITVDSDKTISFKDKEIVVAYYQNGWKYEYFYDLNLQYKQPIGEGMKFIVDGISYTITSAAEGNYRVTTTASEYSNIGANNDVAGEVVIPETVSFNGYDFTVTAIGKYSFSQSKITNLTIPATVTSIAYAAFFNCSDLQYVTDLATSPQRIGTYDYVFYGSSYNSAVLFVPEESVAAYKAATEWKDFGKVIAIGADPDQVDAGDNFVYDGITYTVIDPQAYTVKTKEGAYVNGYWEGQNVGKDNLEIPDEVYFQGDAYTVVEIGNGSFAWCDEGEGLQSISIPDSVTTIGEGAFSENYNVTSVSLGSGLEYVGADAFYSADSLKEVSITAVVPPVADEDAFFSTTVSRVTLTVPALSLEVYETAQVWKDFNIVADDGSTGINSLESIDGSEVIYNLNGVRVSKDRLTKGIYIINGQKVLVK